MMKLAKPNATFIGTLVSGISAILVGFSFELLSIDISFLWIMPISFSVGVMISIVLSLAGRTIDFSHGTDGSKT